MRIAAGDLDRMDAARRPTSASSSSAGTTRFTSPRRCASCASMKSPVTSISKTLLAPHVSGRPTLGVAQEQPDIDARHREAGVVRRHGEVAHRHQLAARGGGDAVHARDHGLRQLGELHHELPAQAEQALLEVERVVAAHLLEVVAGAEGLALAGDDHHAHRLVARDLVDRGDQGLEHLERERIELLQAVERDFGTAGISRRRMGASVSTTGLDSAFIVLSPPGFMIAGLGGHGRQR